MNGSETCMICRVRPPPQFVSSFRPLSQYNVYAHIYQKDAHIGV